jgi:hypothetical protein
MASYRAQYPERFKNPEDASQAEVLFEQLCAQGLLVSELQWRKTVEPVGLDEQEPLITRAAFVTKDRPALLARALTSLEKNLSRLDRKVTAIVYDDSTDDETEHVVNEFHLRRSTRTLQVAYAGRSQKRRYLDQLQARSGEHLEILRFALDGLFDCGPAYGANMNAALLDNAGLTYACLDDDVVCALAPAPDFRGGLTLSSVPLDECWVYCTRPEALSAAQFGRANGDSATLLELHERLLGKPVGACMSEFSRYASVELSGISPRMTTNLAKYGGRVAATMLGIAGDSGTSNSNWCLLNGESRNRLWETKDRFEALNRSHEVVRFLRDFVISDSSRFMNYACALDAREILPPFLPLMRNMDGVFAATLRKCDKARYVGHIPAMILHDPPQRCVTTFGDRGPRLAELVMMAVTEAETGRGVDDLASNLSAAGRHLEDIGRMRRRKFELWLSDRYCEYAASGIRACEATLTSSEDAPQFWRDAIIGQQRAYRALLADTSNPGASDLRAGSAGCDAVTWTQQLILLFGRLLQAWPAIYGAALSLRRDGITIAELAAARCRAA